MRTIFIAEDEETTRNGLCHFVDWTAMGLRVQGTADDGKTALPQLENAEQLPDILMTDVKMPHMDGIELARQVRERWPNMPIIFLSGYNDTAFLRAAIHIGASDYLLKPIDFEELAECMRRVIGRLDQLPSAPDSLINNAAVACAIRIIRERYAENITIQSLADHVYLTPNYLSMLFHQETGQTISDYLTDIRIERAKELLRQQQIPVRDISIAVGWQNPSYLAKRFRMATGLTPLEYRNSSGVATPQTP